MIIQIKKTILCALICNINMIFCAMSPTNETIQEIVQTAAVSRLQLSLPSIAKMLNTDCSSYRAKRVYCNGWKQCPELTYLPQECERFKKECVTGKINFHINAERLHIPQNQCFYESQVMLWTPIKLYSMDAQAAMRELNSIEESIQPILRRTQYGLFDTNLIEALITENSYFKGLIQTIINAQTRWQDLTASNIDHFFKWHGKQLKKSNIGTYIHLEVMRRYAEEFAIEKYNDKKLMQHMLFRVLYNIKDNKEELELLLKTNSFYAVKDNEAIQQLALNRIEELKKSRENL